MSHTGGTSTGREKAASTKRWRDGPGPEVAGTDMAREVSIRLARGPRAARSGRGVQRACDALREGVRREVAETAREPLRVRRAGERVQGADVEGEEVEVQEPGRLGARARGIHVRGTSRGLRGEGLREGARRDGESRGGRRSCPDERERAGRVAR